MPRTSAGILLYRNGATGIEIFLVHMGGPLWSKKDAGAWTFPKGEHDDGEEPLAAARREFREETGFDIDGNFLPLDPIKQSGKIIRLWAVEGDCDADAVRSEVFSLEWPPKAGRQQEFPEIDRAAWFSPDEARQKLVPAQRAFVDQLLRTLG
jgi:predicted NUDIX family NTP pyrophosphohydrolase